MNVSYNIIKDRNVADFLIVTATARETNAFKNVVKPINKETLEVVYQNITYTIGKLGLYNVIHCQCTEMGAVSKGSSLNTVSNALLAWPCVCGVVMVGIAFGLKPDDNNPQMYGDVLICDKLLPYESQRVSKDRIEHRGKELDSDSVLRSAFTEIARHWVGFNYEGEKVCAKIGPILTGEKLVDNKDYRDSLLRDYPNAIGGEMEGLGVYSACANHTKPWILVKSICDFADGKKGEMKNEKQDSAAKLAFDVCLETFNDETILKLLVKDKSSFIYNNNIPPKFVLFNVYSPDKEPFYLKRNFDTQLEEKIQSHGCWIYGDSGVGKSVALSRAVSIGKKPFINFDLSTCVGLNVDEMFLAIYEMLSDKLEEPIQNNIKNYRQCVNTIFNLLEKHYVQKDVLLFFDEIPLDSDDGEFTKFIDEFVGMIIASRKFEQKVNINFLLSSIESPVPYLHRHQKKLSSNLKILQMKRWTKEECLSLIKILNDSLGFTFDGSYKDEEFLEKVDYSPRIIKDVLLQAISTDNMHITKDLVNKLLEDK